MIIPHHYMQINPWLWYINWPYLSFWFTVWKGLCSWENAEKTGDLGNFQLWSQLLMGKTCDNTTQILKNQTLAHRHQLALSIFLIHHVQGSFFLRKHRINREFVKFWCTKPNLDRQKAWYYNSTTFKSILGSQTSIDHIYIFDSPCARVFFPEKMQKKWVICEILMHEAKSWQAKNANTRPLYENKILAQRHQFSISFFFSTMCKGLFSWENTEKKSNLWNIHAWSQILTGKKCDNTTPLYPKWTLTCSYK